MINFITDKKADIELCLLLMHLAALNENQTKISKKGSWAQLNREYCKYRSRQTLLNHLNYLKKHKYLIEEKEYYIFNCPYFFIGNRATRLMTSCFSDKTIRTFFYLRNKKRNVFSIEEICESLGESRTAINNVITILINAEYIKVEECFLSNNEYQFIIKEFAQELKPKPVHYIGEEEEYEN